jgi:hypothetical protein
VSPLCMHSLHRQLSHHLHALHAPLSSDNVYDVRRPTYDGTGVYATRRHTRRYARSLEPGGSGARAIVLCGKQLPVVVLMRGGGRRCVWPVDTASGLSARVLEDNTRDGMARAPRGCCLGCRWDMVVVVYVGETVHVRTSQLQAPTHTAPKTYRYVRCHEKRVLVRVSSTQRDALDARCEASYSGGRRPTELIDHSRQLRRHDTNRRTRCGPVLYRGV